MADKAWEEFGTFSLRPKFMDNVMVDVVILLLVFAFLWSPRLAVESALLLCTGALEIRHKRRFY